MLKDLLLETIGVLVVIGKRFSIKLDGWDELELREYIKDLNEVDQEIEDFLLSIEVAEKKEIGEELILLRSSLLDYVSCIEDVKGLVKKLIEEMLKRKSDDDV